MKFFVETLLSEDGEYAITRCANDAKYFILKGKVHKYLCEDNAWREISDILAENALIKTFNDCEDAIQYLEETINV